MKTEQLEIRPAARNDRSAIWRIFQEVIRAGETYAIDPATSRGEGLAFWFGRNAQVFVAERAGRTVGSYYVKPNQGGGGAHVANAAFIVAGQVRGQGVGRAMAQHCLAEAQKLGFRAMQFNFVISTNPALRLWQELGFEVIGTLPHAFQTPGQEFVDVHILFRSLDKK